MKWIGQHIYDLVSRFRDDVYLEDISTGTIASGGNLGLDSSNKIVKATDSAPDADASTKGIVELATTAETTSGTDSTRAVTPDGLKDGYQGSTNITTLGTIGTGTWQGTAVASAYLDADTAHLSTQKQLTWHGITDDIDTTKQYIGLLDADSENTSTTNGDLPFCAPVAGKLLKVFLSTNTNLTGRTLTWRLETQALGVTFGTGPTIVGTQSGAGPHNDSRTMITYDFTTSLDSGDNLIDAGDMVYLSVQSSGATAQTKFYITCLWEWNLS